MRASAAYVAALEHVGSRKAGATIGYLGDQSLYSWLAASWSEWNNLFYTLPCEWNRQLSMHFGFENSSVHSCPRRCSIVHLNWRPIKCVAQVMQSNPSCKNWERFQLHLSSQKTNVRPATTTESSSLNIMEKCMPSATQRERKMNAMLQHGIRRFFKDCCI